MLFPIHDDNPVDRWPYVTVAIIAINLVCLVYVQQLNPYQRREFQVRHGFIPARLQAVNGAQAIRIPLYTPEELAVGMRPPAGKPPFVDLPLDTASVLPTTVTSLFLHAGWIHLLGNMWFFWIFGDNIEDRLGHFIFALFYVVGGLIASTCHWLMTSAAGGGVPVIGASGAVAVTLGAYAVTYPFTRVKTVVFLIIFFTVIELPALVILGLWFIAQLASAVNVVDVELAGGVAWWAHIGGFAAGAALMPFVAAGTQEPGQSWDQEAREQFDAPLPRRDWM